MAVVKVFKERDQGKYGQHTFKNELKHLEYLLKTYTTKEEKVLSREWVGINCNDNPELAYEEMINTKQEYGKYDPGNTKSREFKHYTIAFPHDESKMLGAANVTKMVKEICERIPEFNNFQISIITHEDKEHIHSHIIVNSVNMLDGHKIQLPKSFLTKFQAICNEYTSSQGLSTLRLPNSLKTEDQNVSYNYVDYNAHKESKISKTEMFANRLNEIIKNTRNKKDLYRVMKENDLKMIWRDDEQYKEKLRLGKITIIDNKTNEKHRLETLVKKYNINVSNNLDLLNHFKEIERINDVKNEVLIKSLKINKKDLIQLTNKNELKNQYKIIRDKIQEYKNKKYIIQNESSNKEEKVKYFYQLDVQLKNEIKDFAKQLYNSSTMLQEKTEEKTNELLIKAKEINKNLDFDNEKKNVEEYFLKVVCNRIFYETLYNKQPTITDITLNFMLKGIINSVLNVDHNHYSKDALDRDRKLKEQKDLNKKIKQAITY